MTVATAPRTEPVSLRRGYPKVLRQQLRDSAGNPMPLTGWTITPGLTQTESKDGAAVSGVTPTITTVDSPTGVFDYTFVHTETTTLVVGKSYWYWIYGSHATYTNSKPELLKVGIVKVVA